jgi:hypothetical protein
MWNHRRDREALKDYRGALMWHEGEIRFKKDCTLDGLLPIPLTWAKMPTDAGANYGDLLIVTDRDLGTRVHKILDPEKRIRINGRLRPGGYASLMTTVAGYYGFLGAHDSDFTYVADVPSWTGLKVGLGQRGQQVKAGEVLKYRFAIGTFPDESADNELLAHTANAFNLDGGTDGYPVDMAVGTLRDAVFFFTAQADQGEARFTLGPQDLIIELPVRVAGLEDNGCVAMFSDRRGWFRFVPVVDGMAYFQEDIGQANNMWVGNILLCDNKAVRMTVVVDGQAEGSVPFVEVHNPTDEVVNARVHSPAHTPLFGGSSFDVSLPAGDSVKLKWEGEGTRNWKLET